MVVKTIPFNNTTAFDTEKTVQIPSTARAWEIQSRGPNQNHEFRVATKSGQVTPNNSRGEYFSSRIENNNSRHHLMGEISDIQTDPLTLYIAIESTANNEDIEVRYW